MIYFNIWCKILLFNDSNLGFIILILLFLKTLIIFGGVSIFLKYEVFLDIYLLFLNNWIYFYINVIVVIDD